MNYRCVLRGCDFLLVFNMDHISEKYLDVQIDLVINSSVQDIAIRSVPNYITIDEIMQIIHYLDEHLTHIEVNSPVFIPIEVGFQLQAQMGDKDESGNGYISLLILLNVGFNKKGDRIYSGGKMIVDLDEISAFIRDLRIISDAFH